MQFVFVKSRHNDSKGYFIEVASVQAVLTLLELHPDGCLFEAVPDLMGAVLLHRMGKKAKVFEL